jgi:hypothetical protein
MPRNSHWKAPLNRLFCAQVNACEEVIDFIASGPTPGAIISFRPSQEANERIALLIEREKAARLSPEEKTELDHYVEVDHIMRLAKARARA